MGQSTDPWVKPGVTSQDEEDTSSTTMLCIRFVVEDFIHNKRFPLMPSLCINLEWETLLEKSSISISTCYLL